MNIGIVLYPTFGGSGIVATELGIHLAKKGHNIHFITYRQPARLTKFYQNIFYHEVAIRDYPLFEYSPYEFVLSSKIVDVCLHESLDLLHVHYAIPHASAAYMAKAILADKGCRVPYITTLHGTDITLLGKDPSFETAITFAINQSDAVTTVSESLRNDTLENFAIKTDIEVVPNFYDARKFSQSSIDELKRCYAPNGEKIVCHISNFRPVKRIHDAIKAFQIARKGIAAKFILIGDGPERPFVQSLCRELDICDDVIFLGKSSKVDPLLSIADAFILPSEKESFGLSSLEAMSYGVPVISSNAGGIPEVNISGETGFTSNVGDFKDMGENLLKLLSDSELHQEMSKNCLHRSLKFSSSTVIPRYEKIYETVLNS